jgi:hypothetical protein
MGKLFTPEFFKFLLAFSLIIISSFAFLLATSYHQADSATAKPVPLEDGGELSQ